jgi:hypothetical protein
LAGRNQEDCGSRPDWAKSTRPHFNQYSALHVPPAVWRSTNRIEVQADPDIKQDPISKITNTKRARRVPT